MTEDDKAAVASAVGRAVIAASRLETTVAFAVQQVREGVVGGPMDFRVAAAWLSQPGGACEEMKSFLRTLPAGPDRERGMALHLEARDALGVRHRIVHSVGVKQIDADGEWQPVWLHPKSGEIEPFDIQATNELADRMLALGREVDAWAKAVAGGES
jgi:hypothetical protein